MNGVSAFLLQAFKGALIGAGAILPGVSGGVLCLAMGIYQPMMALFANPFREIRSRFWFFLPVVIGFAAGVLGLSKLLVIVFGSVETEAVWLFIGLIAGTMPGLWRDAGAKGREKKHLLSGAIAFVIAFNLLMFLNVSDGTAVEPNVFIWALCGVLWAMGFMVPGMSPSALFIFLSVYEPMSAGIAAFDWSVILPMGATLILTVVALSRGVTKLFDRKYSYAMHISLGVAAASAVSILPIGAPADFAHILIYQACFMLGLFVALWMDKLNEGIQKP